MSQHGKRRLIVKKILVRAVAHKSEVANLGNYFYKFNGNIVYVGALVSVRVWVSNSLVWEVCVSVYLRTNKI